MCCQPMLHCLLAGAAKDTDNKPELRTARKSTSRKQLQFAPLQLGHIPGQPSRKPSNGADAELLSPGRSKSLGSVVDCSLLKDAADAELAVSKDRPHSAQFQRTVLHWNSVLHCTWHVTEHVDWLPALCSACNDVACPVQSQSALPYLLSPPPSCLPCCYDTGHCTQLWLMHHSMLHPIMLIHHLQYMHRSVWATAVHAQCCTINDASWCESDLGCIKHSIIPAFIVTHPVLCPWGPQRSQTPYHMLHFLRTKQMPHTSSHAASSKTPLIVFHSNGVFWLQVHMRDVTVFADEHAALELVSQGSIQSAARRVSHSKQVPLLDAERRRSHSRASTPTAKDMQTGAPSLDFQIMYADPTAV